MKKYFYIYKTQIMSNLQYTLNLLFSFIGYIVMIFILFNLWNYLYSDPEELINGYNMFQMTWYVIVTEILWMSLGGRQLCQKISNDIKAGNIAYTLNKPYTYILYWLFQHLGEITIKTILFSILSLIFGFIFLGSFPELSFPSILLIIIICIFALIISTLLITCIGLFSLFIEDANPFFWMYSKFILVLGTLFPIEFFPKAMQGFLSYSPIYVVSYGPANLFVNFSYEKALSVIIAQIIYIGIAYLLCSLVYRRGVKKINVNGG